MHPKLGQFVHCSEFFHVSSSLTAFEITDPQHYGPFSPRKPLLAGNLTMRLRSLNQKDGLFPIFIKILFIKELNDYILRQNKEYFNVYALIYIFLVHTRLLDKWGFGVWAIRN